MIAPGRPSTSSRAPKRATAWGPLLLFVSTLAAGQATPGLAPTKPSLPIRQLLPCAPRTITLQVRSSAFGGDGTDARPFGTIAQALARAAAENVCDVVVEIGSGTFGEPFELSRGTTLRGSGRDRTVIRATIGHRAGLRLTVERLAVRAPSGPAVAIAHRSAETTLHEVTIDAAARHGVRQSGGSLHVSDVSITATLGGKFLYDGAAIFVDGGAQVRLERLTLARNAQGLVVSGVATKVVASRLDVREGTFNTSFQGDVPNGEGLGAVEVRNATLLLEDSTIWDNVGIGLMVSDRARIHARRVAVNRVRSLPPPNSGYGSIGLLLMFSEVELVDVSSGNAGIAVTDWQSGATATGLSLHDALVGIDIRSTDEVGRIRECLGRIQLQRVETDSTLYRPGGGLPLPAAPMPPRPSNFCLETADGPVCEGRYGTFLPCARVRWE